MTLEERFWKKVNKTDNCWIWQAATRGKTGYGSLKYNKKVIDAHRMSWILSFGKIPEGKYICHKCDNRLCVNPEHLFVGSPKENWLDGFNKGRIVGLPKIWYQIGHHSTQRKISLEDAIEIKNLYLNTNMTQKIIGEKYNISTRAIRYILSGETYKN